MHMKKIFLLLFALLGFSNVVFAQGVSFTLDLTAGQLTDVSGATMSANSLILVLDLGSSSTLSPITAGSYTSGTNFVIASTGFSTPYNTNEESATLTINSGAGAKAGDEIAIEWFPGTSSSSYPSTTTTAGEAYGAFDPSGGVASGTTTWTVPSSGTISLDFYTADDGGTYANSTGYANYTVAAAPEPATYALLFFALPLFYWGYRRQAALGLVKTR
jgi:hypothetical protein